MTKQRFIQSSPLCFLTYLFFHGRYSAVQLDDSSLIYLGYLFITTPVGSSIDIRVDH